MGSFRIRPDNEHVSTIGPGGAYTSLNLWAAATARDLVSEDISEVAELLVTYALTENTFVRYAITSATCRRIIRPVAGAEHQGNPFAGIAVRRVNIGESYSCIFDIKGGYTANGPSNLIIFAMTDTEGPFVGRRFGALLVNGAANLGAGSMTAFSTQAYGDGEPNEVIACEVISAETQPTDDGFAAVGDAGNVAWLNCTARQCLTNYNVYGGNVQAVNCLADLGTAADFAGEYAAGSDYNAGSDDSAPGDHSLHGLTAEQIDFISPIDANLHLGPESVLRAGDNLSAQFTDDIDGHWRPGSGPWDIGMDQRLPVGGPFGNMDSRRQLV